MALSSFNAEIRGLQRLLVGHADDVDMDGSGPHPRAARAAPVRGARASRRARRARATSSSCGTTRSGSEADGARDHVPRGRAAARARRLLSLMADGVHVPVLLEEAVAALAIVPDGIYVDATFGRGGHARAILAALGAVGRLVALDRDPAAAAARARYRRSALHVSPRAGSPSSPHVLADARHRARSTACSSTSAFRRRRSTIPRAASRFAPTARSTCGWIPTRGESAAAFLARADARELTEVIRDYGEERFAQSIARAIVAARAVAPVVRTRQLAAIVAQAVGARPRGDRSQDPATRTFQALRIFVNRELAELALTLPRDRAAARRPAAGSP